MAYQRVRVVTDAEMAGEAGAAGLALLYQRIPSLRLALALVFLYVPLWWGVGYATEYIGGLILPPVLGLAASAASYWLLRKLFTGYQYDPVLAVLITLLLGIGVLGGVGATAFGQQHRNDLIGVGLLYLVAAGVLFIRFRAQARSLFSPLFWLLYMALLLALAAPLIAGSARLLVRPIIPRVAEVPLVKVQFFGGALIDTVYTSGDAPRARAQCDAGAHPRMSEADVLSGKPVPEDSRRASCRVMSPYQPAFVCPDAAQMSRVHDSVRERCESWAKYLKSAKS